MKRLGIFLFFDEEGIVDNYINVLLDDMVEQLNRLVIVCNGILSVEGRKKFEKYTKDIFVRKNEGFDFCAWRDTMFEYIGFERVKEFDQLVLFNDSFFGPFYSFKYIFGDMDKKQYDFWGLTVHGEVDSIKNMCPYGYRPRYLQTYFLVINKRMLNDSSFYMYWHSLPVYSRFIEVSEKISAVFTKYFEDLGFSWGCYSDTTDLEQNRDTNICHHAFNIYELICERKYPIIKRKSFILGKSRYLQYNLGIELEKTVEYIKNKTNYCIPLIYEHIIRKYNISEIKESLNLNFVIEDKKGNIIGITKKWAVLVFLFENTELNYCIEKIDSIPNEIDIFIWNNESIIPPNIQLFCNKKNIKLMNNTYSNFPDAFLSEIANYQKRYDYICILHSVPRRDDVTFTVERSVMYLAWENMLNNIIDILEIFMANSHIGLILPPKPWFCDYVEEGNYQINEDVECFRNWENLIGQNIKYQEKNYIMGGSGAFWMRGKTLEGLCIQDDLYECDYKNLTENMIKCFNYILPYICQNNGYLTATCSLNRYAAAEMEALRYMNTAAVQLLENVANGKQKSFVHLLKEANGNYIKICNIAKKPKVIKEEVTIPVEVPVLIEIGLKRALKNYIKKLFKGGTNEK